MRWFVEVASIGKGDKPADKFCVEASQWQPALQKARALRGDDGTFTNFSIELLDDGYRAIDPATRLRYVVRKAPADAELTPAGKSIAAPSTAAPATEPPRPGKTAVAGTSSPSAKPPASARTPSVKPSAAPPRPASESTGPTFDLIAKREDEPTAAVPLLYREYAYAMRGPADAESARALLGRRLDEIKKTIEDRKCRRLIRLAAFDHHFDARPERPPLATLEWRDWRDARTKSAPAPAAAPAPAPAPAARTTPVPALVPPARTDEIVVDEAPVSEPSPPTPRHGSGPPPSAAQIQKAISKPSPSSPAPASAPAPAPAPPEVPRAHDDEVEPSEPTTPDRVLATDDRPSAPRLSGDDLLAELFEAFSDLGFLQHPLDGAEFVLRTTLAKLPSEVGLVSFFDINKREFVVVRSRGEGDRALLTRFSESSPLAHAAMTTHHSVVVADAVSDDRVDTARWTSLKIEARSLICAPAELGGRYLGLIELVNPIGDEGFSPSDGHALTYIGQQFAEFLASRGLILDPDTIAAHARARAPQQASDRPGR